MAAAMKIVIVALDQSIPDGGGNGKVAKILDLVFQL